MSESTGGARRSLFQLIAALPGLIGDLLRAELDALKAELKERAVRAGIGIGLLLGAAVFVFFAVFAGLIAAIAGIATALPVWASALIVFGGLVLIAVILLFIGLASLKSSGGRIERIDAIKADIAALGPSARHAAHDAEQGEA